MQKIISAGAGSGKTYRLTKEMVQLLRQEVRASGIIATTFTQKAAAELQERVRVSLLEEGMIDQANDLSNALIGTVHSLGVRLLKRFAFEAGVSPAVTIIAEEDQQFLFNNALASVLREQRVQYMEQLATRLGFHKKDNTNASDWRKDIRNMTDIIRMNNFSDAIIEKSKILSFKTFKGFLGEPNNLTEADALVLLNDKIVDTLERVEANVADTTKTTLSAVKELKDIQRQITIKGTLNWFEWAKLTKIEPGAKSKEIFNDFHNCAKIHEGLTAFHNDIQSFTSEIFDIAKEALQEYEKYKKHRGLIDYTDMEVHVSQLLQNEHVRKVLSEEIDLLMVDEFQDTSPMQLAIFYQLTALARKASIWVGDPKQSIYGFRGADPKMMQAIIKVSGGIKKQNILEHSWRSRKDLVNVSNAIFTKAFNDLPTEQIALKPKREDIDNMQPALIQWQIEHDGGGKKIPDNAWVDKCIATNIKNMIGSKQYYILPKGAAPTRLARAGDFAILCRSNAQCNEMAKALHHIGLSAAIARTGLFSTAEAKLLLACLKFILHRSDSLSVAEILRLAAKQPIEKIIEHRMAYLEKLEDTERDIFRWAEENYYIQRLNELRRQMIELSSTEILNMIIEELDLRRIIAAWGNKKQRLDNVDVIRKFAFQYEDACNRLHSAASLGVLLLYFDNLEKQEDDQQASGESPDAVNVLTYHKSKGLEYPIVVMKSLENSLKDSVWGMNIIPETEEVDLNDILGNRWLRYWINPYSDQIAKTTLIENIDNSDAKAAIRQQALAEENRLLYVGITRARDYLIFPTTKKSTTWLNRAFNNGNENIPTLDGTNETPFEWEGEYLKIDVQKEFFVNDFPKANLIENDIKYIEEKSGKINSIPYFINLERDNFNLEYSVRLGNTYKYTNTLHIKPDFEDIFSVAKALKNFIAADDTTVDITKRIEMATAFQHRLVLEEAVEVKDLLQHSNAFFHYLYENYTISNLYKNYPLRYIHDKRAFETVVDFIFDTGKDLIIIQNISSSNDEKKIKNTVYETASWAYLTQKALSNLFKGKGIQIFINAILQGELFELEIINQNIRSNETNN